MSAPISSLAHRHEAGRSLPVCVWRLPESARAIASGPLGGGIGVRHWVINATVDTAYARLDPDVHLGEIAGDRGLVGAGVGMLTAVDVRDAASAVDGGVSVVATVGLAHPTWAAAPDGDLRQAWPSRPGTINIVAWIPAPLDDAALVNAVATATEAKTQALWVYGVEATGTASDALCIACLCPTAGGVEPAQYGGPRSVWGARLARAVHAAVLDGTGRWVDRPALRGPSRS